MESFKSLWNERRRLPESVVTLSRVALMFGMFTAAVVWLIAPSTSQSPVSVPGKAAAQSQPTVSPAPTRSRPIAAEESEAVEEAVTEASPAEAAAPTPSTSPTSEAEPEATDTATPAAPPPAAPTPPAPTPPPVAQAPSAPAPPPEDTPELVSVAAGARGNRLAVIRLGAQVQTLASGERLGRWTVRRIGGAQVVLQQGNRTLVLAFGRDANASATSSPASEANRPQEAVPPPQPPTYEDVRVNAPPPPEPVPENNQQPEPPPQEENSDPPSDR